MVFVQVQYRKWGSYLVQKCLEGWVDNIPISHNNLTNFVISSPSPVTKTLTLQQSTQAKYLDVHIQKLDGA